MQSWQDRHAIWIRSLRSSDLHFDQLLIVDDASPVLPEWPDVSVIHEADAPHARDVRSAAPIVLYTHQERLGRQSIFEFPGWYRSFAFGVLYGAVHGFEKIIHIESDAHLVSRRMQIYYNSFCEGWSSAWCRKYQFPEIAVQIMAGSGVALASEFVKGSYDRLNGQLHETVLPFTQIEKMYVGDRYGEDLTHVPEDADFSTQTLVGQQASYYWWIKDISRWPVRRKSVASALAPFTRAVISGDWAESEQQYAWMIDFDSSVYLPAVKRDGNHDLEIEVFPCTYKDRNSQRLMIFFNEMLLSEVSISEETVVSVPVPAGLARLDGLNQIRMLHPDAFVPNAIGDHPETRRLSVALKRCELFLRPEMSTSTPIPFPARAQRTRAADEQLS